MPGIAGMIRGVASGLSDAGFMARAIAHGPAAVTALAQLTPHLVMIDWHTQNYSALDMVGRALAVRAPHTIRLVLVSDLSSEPDVVAGLNLGADDYVVKPYSLREVVARVLAILRPRRL
jgi:DNA-binding response OmpR family regulator